MAVKLLSKYNTITEALGFNLTDQQARKFGFNPLKRKQDIIETVAAMYNYDITQSTFNSANYNVYYYNDPTKSYFFREFDDLEHEGLLQAVNDLYSIQTYLPIPNCTCSGKKITGAGTEQYKSEYVYKNNSLVSCSLYASSSGQVAYNSQKWIGDYGKTSPWSSNNKTSYTHAFVDQRTEILKTITDSNSVITGFKDFIWSTYKPIMLWDDITNGNAKLWGRLIPNYSIFLIAKDDTIKVNLEANIEYLNDACRSIDTYDEIMIKITGATSKTDSLFYNGVLIGYRVGLYIYIFPPTTGLHYVFYDKKNINLSSYPLITDENGHQYIDWDNIYYNAEYTEALGAAEVDPRILDKLDGMYYIDCDEYNPQISTIEILGCAFWHDRGNYFNVPNNIFPQLIIRNGQNSDAYYVWAGMQYGILRYKHRQKFTDEQYNILYTASQQTTITAAEKQQLLYYIVTNFITVTNPTFADIIEYAAILNVTEQSFDIGWCAPMIFNSYDSPYTLPPGSSLKYEKNTILGSHTFTYTTNDPIDVLQAAGFSEPFSTKLTISVDDAWVQMSYVGLVDQSGTNAMLNLDTLAHGSIVAPYAGEAIINQARFTYALKNIHATTRFALTGSSNLIPGGYQEFNVPVHTISDDNVDTTDHYNTLYDIHPPYSVYLQYYVSKRSIFGVLNKTNNKILGIMISAPRYSNKISIDRDGWQTHIGAIDIYYETTIGNNGAIYPYDAVGDAFFVTSYPKVDELYSKYPGVLDFSNDISDIVSPSFTDKSIMYNLLDFATIINIPKNSDGTYNFSSVTSLVFSSKETKSYKPSRYTVKLAPRGFRGMHIKLLLGTKQTVHDSKYNGLLASWKAHSYSRSFVQDEWLEIVYNTNKDTYSIDLTGMVEYLSKLKYLEYTLDISHVEDVLLMINSSATLLVTGTDY